MITVEVDYNAVAGPGQIHASEWAAGGAELLVGEVVLAVDDEADMRHVAVVSWARGDGPVKLSVLWDVDPDRTDDVTKQDVVSLCSA